MNKTICESEYGGSPQNYHIHQRDDVLSVELTYPNITKGGCTTVEIDQESVRASDGIRVRYDYDRDGWAIYQPRPYYYVDHQDQMSIEDEWVEVAFVQSWALMTDEIARSLGHIE